MSIITISRQPYSCGDEVAKQISQSLGWELITREKLLSEFLPDIVFAHDINMLKTSAKYYLNPFGKTTYLDYIRKSLNDYAKTNSAVFAGFGSQMIFSGLKDAIHIRIIAPQDMRIKKVIKDYDLSEGEAEKILLTADRKQRRFITTLFDEDITDPVHYNLTINMSSTTVAEAADCVLSLVEGRSSHQEEEQAEEEPVQQGPNLKNPAEVEFAKLLDMYNIGWKYEPKAFPIEWDAEGNVTSAFRPDFYLTDFDTYIELTTMNQRYVTQKNRKAKKLKKLYPDVNIKIVYKKDFHSLVERFNLSRGGTK